MPKLIADLVEPGSVASTDQPVLSIDEELELRPFRVADADVVVAAFSTPDIQYFHSRRLDHDEAMQWIQHCGEGWTSETSATWAIVDRRVAQVVGRVTIYMSLTVGHGEVSYWLLPGGRGRGSATRACVAATRWAHGIGLHRIELQHSNRNDASRAVAARAEYRHEGIRREALLLVDGWHDMVLHAHLSTDDP